MGVWMSWAISWASCQLPFFAYQSAFASALSAAGGEASRWAEAASSVAVMTSSRRAYGSARRLVFGELATFLVGERPGGDQDDVDDRPDADAAAGEQLEDAGADLAHVEAVRAEG